jgi:hypothetical protein
LVFEAKGIAADRICGGEDCLWAEGGERGRADDVGEIEFRIVMASDGESVAERFAGSFRKISCDQDGLKAKIGRRCDEGHGGTSCLFNY